MFNIVVNEERLLTPVNEEEPYKFTTAQEAHQFMASMNGAIYHIYRLIVENQINIRLCNYD